MIHLTTDQADRLDRSGDDDRARALLGEGTVPSPVVVVPLIQGKSDGDGWHLTGPLAGIVDFVRKRVKRAQGGI
jgi:hypothetical protein